jgi:hypothetical protein
MFDLTGNKRVAEEALRDSDVESPHDSDHSSDILVSAADKQDLIVSVRDLLAADGIKKMQLSISNLRPSTALGKAQGDHVTAYQCLLEMLMIAVAGQPLRLCAEIIATTAKSILPDQSMTFDTVLALQLAQIESVLTPEERHELLGPKDQYDVKKIRLDNSLKMARRAVFKQMVEQIGETFIREVNLDAHTAFARVGAMDRAQGSRVKKAIHGLKAINDLANLIEILSDSSINIVDQEQRVENFYNDYIKTYAPYKDGANEIFGTVQITCLNTQWERLSGDQRTTSLQTLQLELLTSGDFIKVMGSCFGNLFDFKYDVHKDAEDAAAVLFEVIAKHMVVMFRAFPRLRSFEEAIKENIIDEFINECVLKEQRWSQFSILIEENEKPIPMSIALVKAEVLKLIDFTEYRLVSSDEKIAIDAALPMNSSITSPKLM